LFDIHAGMQIESGIEPPAKQVKIPRLTDAVRAMTPGQSFLCDEPTAKSFRQFGAYHRWEVREQKQADGSFRMWRVS
jgi:hypothetical protein